MTAPPAQLRSPEVRRSREFPLRLDLAKAFSSRKARERRYKKICELVSIRPHDRILDVGCGAGRSLEDFNRENQIVGLDLDPQQKIFQDNFRFVPGDAASMGFFQNGEFDVVLSIGVLERVVPYENLQRAAREIERVGKAYVVVVPHMFTIIEPHSQLPFGQFFPQNFRRFARRWDLIRSDKEGPNATVEGENLLYLRAREWQLLFPKSTIISYSHLGMGLLRDFIIYKTRPLVAT